jgi:23S rRNA (cytidine1920-2'-O)/16S rRNA (cytidine1409-2'-O)-methyltransferase
MAKQRLDTLLVDRGLAESREKAQALVMAGQVRVNEQMAPKPGVLVPDDAALAVAEGQRFVSRGGEKLAHALETFDIDVTGLTAVDVGSSTGGFTDCLLQNRAARVYAVDVGRGQLDYRLRTDQRVAVMEGVNARDLTLPETVDFAVADLSFISLRLVLPAIAANLSSGDRVSTRPASARGTVIALFKPQFEAEKNEVPRGGVIKAPQLQATLIGRFVRWCTENGFRVLSLTTSPILGAEGNREFLFWLRPGRRPVRERVSE